MNQLRPEIIPNRNVVQFLDTYTTQDSHDARTEPTERRRPGNGRMLHGGATYGIISTNKNALALLETAESMTSDWSADKMTLPQEDSPRQLSFDDIEQWRTVPGYEGHYWVSAAGNVKSRTKQLSPSKGGSGYLVVNLSKDGNHRTYGVHQLILLAFIGPCPAGHEVDHINFVRADNRLENLRYLTIYENRSRGSTPKPKTTTFQEQYPLSIIQHELLYALSIGLKVEINRWGQPFIYVKTVNNSLGLSLYRGTLKKLHAMGCLDGYEITPFGLQVVAEHGVPITFDLQAWNEHWTKLGFDRGSGGAE